MINWRDGIRAMKCGLLAVFLLITASSTSQAGPLGVVIEPIPSLIAGLITSTYNATTGAFTSTGFALTLDKGLGKQNISGSFSLTATISNQGVVNNATVRVGTIASPQLFSSTLLAPSFAFTSTGTLEFLFTNVSGSYVSTGIYGATTPLDVMFTGLGAAFPGNFLTSFTSTQNTVEIREDGPAPPPEIPNPEPSTLLLVLAGAGGLYRQVRKRKQS